MKFKFFKCFLYPIRNLYKRPSQDVGFLIVFHVGVIVSRQFSVIRRDFDV